MKRQNNFQITLSNNIQTLENLLTNSQVLKETITTSSLLHFLTSTFNQTGPSGQDYGNGAFAFNQSGMNMMQTPLIFTRPQSPS